MSSRAETASTSSTVDDLVSDVPVQEAVVPVQVVSDPVPIPAGPLAVGLLPAVLDPFAPTGRLADGSLVWPEPVWYDGPVWGRHSVTPPDGKHYHYMSRWGWHVGFNTDSDIQDSDFERGSSRFNDSFNEGSDDTDHSSLDSYDTTPIMDE